MKEGFENSTLAEQALAFHCPRWDELPGLALYMDQVTGYINDIFHPICAPGQEPILTKAMVNNYVKLRVIAPPQNKKYSRDHVAYLVAICALKQVFSIPEIARLIQGQISVCPVKQAYDCFGIQLESSLRQAFLNEEYVIPDNDSELLVMRVTQAWADKIFIQKKLEFEYTGEVLVSKKEAKKEAKIEAKK